MWRGVCKFFNQILDNETINSNASIVGHIAKNLSKLTPLLKWISNF